MKFKYVKHSCDDSVLIILTTDNNSIIKSWKEKVYANNNGNKYFFIRNFLNYNPNNTFITGFLNRHIDIEYMFHYNLADSMISNNGIYMLIRFVKDEEHKSINLPSMNEFLNEISDEYRTVKLKYYCFKYSAYIINFPNDFTPDKEYCFDTEEELCNHIEKVIKSANEFGRLNIENSLSRDTKSIVKETELVVYRKMLSIKETPNGIRFYWPSNLLIGQSSYFEFKK